MMRRSSFSLLALAGVVVGLAVAGPAGADLGDGSTLVGLTTDGTVYLDSSADGFCHWIPDTDTFNALGYDWNAITWYGELPCTVGDPLPAIAPPPPAPSAPAVAVRTPQSAGVTVTPLIAKPLASPAAAVAGKALTIRFPVSESDTGQKLTSGSAVVSSSLGGTALKSSVQLANGTASVKLTLPESAHGKQLKVTLTVKTDTAAATRTATFHVA